MTAPRFTAQGWEPIETAPRDGTVIIGLFCNFGQWTYALIHWRRSRDGREEGWFNGVDPEPDEARHWQHLPEPPTPSPSVTREGGE